MKTLNKRKVEDNLKKQGVIVEAGSIKGLLEEAPEVYKDVDEVVKVSNSVGIGNIVCQMKPMIAIKG